ncbi:CBS domain-containing protein [Kushneria avicenniae]|uniref:CBS domain-containing protein n=1 Tax=Kushneria avicenniae TaxID=402385 RepID=A0A1I1KW26_9GAMM|nr:CBS domain-containing protein [Kushneria avicenniae]SFC64989.1 CBS domain-containing protein [Kushneria avicenniae]
MTSRKQASIADIMSRNLVTLRLEQTLHDGNELMREHHIRHLPVLDELGRLAGMLNQKVVLKEALRITDHFGAKRLGHHLGRIPLSDVISRDVQTLSITTPLAEAGQQLLANRQGAMPVLDGEGHLVGILSSVDFVRLAVNLLEDVSD